MNHSYGWVPDRPDQRDYPLMIKGSVVVPSVVDLRPKCSPIVDQGALGSCTANAIAGALEYDQLAQGEPLVPASRLFIYYNERVIEHSVGFDAGAMIRDGVKSVAKQGFCPESVWPYVIDRFAQAPPLIAYQDGLGANAHVYRKVFNSVGSIQGALAAGYPVIFGFTVYESFESPGVTTTGMVPLPGPRESVLGGHAVLAVGYDRLRKLVICRNSWGTSWGDKGYFYMPEGYFGKLTSDLWTITKVS